MLCVCACVTVDSLFLRYSCAQQHFRHLVPTEALCNLNILRLTQSLIDSAFPNLAVLWPLSVIVIASLAEEWLPFCSLLNGEPVKGCFLFPIVQRGLRTGALFFPGNGPTDSLRARGKEGTQDHHEDSGARGWYLWPLGFPCWSGRFGSRFRC